MLGWALAAVSTLRPLRSPGAGSLECPLLVTITLVSSSPGSCPRMEGTRPPGSVLETLFQRTWHHHWQEMVPLESFCQDFGELLLLPPAPWPCRRLQDSSVTPDMRQSSVTPSAASDMMTPIFCCQRFLDVFHLTMDGFGGTISAGCWKLLLRRAPKFPGFLWTLTHSFLLKLPFYCAF